VSVGRTGVGVGAGVAVGVAVDVGPSASLRTGVAVGVAAEVTVGIGVNVGVNVAVRASVGTTDSETTGWGADLLVISGGPQAPIPTTLRMITIAITGLRFLIMSLNQPFP